MKKHLHLDVRGYAKFITLLLLVAASFLKPTQLFAQCGIATDHFSSGPYTPPSNGTVATLATAGSGTYVTFNITVGNIYSFYFNSATTGTGGNDWDMTLAHGSAIINYDDINTPIENDYFGGIACPTTTRPASAEWYATSGTPLEVSINSYNAGCKEYVAGQGSATLEYKECIPTGDPGLPSGNDWYVEAFATTALSIPNFNARYGYYTDATSNLNFSTLNYYNAAQTPSSASTWVSNHCTVPAENWCIRARRTNIPCGVYTFVVDYGDDSIGVYLNGNLIQASACCITSATTFGSTAGYAIQSSDIVEVRNTGVCGNNEAHVVITPVAYSALNGGTIGSNQTICNPGQPAALTNLTSPSGGVSSAYVGGGYTYDWFEEIGCNPPANDLNSNTLGYTFPGNISNSLCIGRTVTDACGNSMVSNTINITVNQPSSPAGGINATSTSVCNNGSTTTLSVQGGTLGTGARWIWYAGGCGSGTPIDSGATITVAPTTQTTYYVRAENPGPCSNPTSCVSITIGVNPIPAVTATPTAETICSGAGPSIALTSTVANTTYTWTVAEASGVTGGSNCTSGCGSNIGQILNNTNVNTATATYTVTGSANGCTSSNTATATITVEPLPAVVANPVVSSICSGSATNIGLSSPTNGTTFAWSVVEGTGISGASSASGNTIAQTLTNSSNNAAANATYTITGTANSCTASATATVTVNPIPTLTATPSVDVICSGSATDVALTSTANGTTYAWSVVEGTGITGGSAGSGTPISQTLSNSSNSTSATATYTVIGTTNNCTSSVTASITVNPTPSITATPAADTICSGSTPSIALTSSAGSTTYSWTVSQTAGISGGNSGSVLQLRKHFLTAATVLRVLQHIPLRVRQVTVRERLWLW